MAPVSLARLLTGVSMVLFASGASSATAEAVEPHTVLTIHWGREDFPGTSVVDAAIRGALQKPGSSPVRYFSEYLETEEFPSEAATLAFRDYIRQKFVGHRVDAVIADATPALQFALQHQSELFPGVPIVFVAGALPGVTIGDTPPGITGLISDVSFAETLELALTVQPTVRRVFIVAQSPTSEGYDERVRSALDPFSARVQLTYVKERSVPDLLATINAIPAAQSAIFYVRYTPEESDTIVHPDEVARLIVQVASVPVYASTYFGVGSVGGVIRAGDTVGALLGERARRILDGERPDDIPIGTVPGVPTLDWRQIQRWGIDPARIPAGADIEFRVPTVWEVYRGYIVGTVIVVVAQLMLITGLLTQRVRRRRAEAVVQRSYQRIRNLAGRLINAQEVARAELARDLHDGMCQELAGMSMAVSTLKNSSGHIQDTPTQEVLSKLQDEALDIYQGIRRLSHDLHPSGLKLLGLAAALKAHCGEVASRHGVEVSFSADGDLGHVPFETAMALFRTAQESLRNGIGHGGASRLTVLLARSNDHVDLTVCDDGEGFDLKAVRRDGTGLGLISMEERAHSVGGDLEILTGPSQGTTVRVRCPVASSAEQCL